MANEDSHFDEASWVGLALGLVPADRAARMQAHLESGCPECSNISRLWSLAAETGARERFYEPPHRVVQAAKALLPFVQRLGLAQPVRMLFDSFRDPLPAGLRGSISPARYLCYETDDFLIDLRLEPGDVKRIAVCGQIVSKPNQAALPEIGVLLTEKPARLLRHTIANSMGEFQFEVENQRSQTLYMRFPDSTIAEIDLPTVW